MKRSATWDKLAAFAEEHRFKTKGSLSVALVVTKQANEKGLPLDPALLKTKSGGQVRGLGSSAVRSILVKHGIERWLAKEGGRTSRGSIANMTAYVELLNELHSQGFVDLEEIERFWIARVRQYFEAKPFRMTLDPAKGLRAVLRDLIRQAQERQKASPGTAYAGAVAQHLVGAKLDCAIGPADQRHNGFSTADSPSNRQGDFALGDTVIHVTTAPTEALIGKCGENIRAGKRPIVVTISRGVPVAEALAEQLEIGDRVDIFEIEQFLALNVYELGRFGESAGKDAVRSIVERYNEIINECETDPSLAIELKQ